MRDNRLAPEFLFQDYFIEVSRTSASSQGELAQEWIANLDYCAKLIQEKLGLVVLDREDTYQMDNRLSNKSSAASPHWETDFTHNYYSYYPVNNKQSDELDFMVRFLKGIEGLEEKSSPDIEVMQALREYWFTLQRFNPDALPKNMGFGIKVKCQNTSAKDLSLRDIAIELIRARSSYNGDAKYRKRIDALINRVNEKEK